MEVGWRAGRCKKPAQEVKSSGMSAPVQEEKPGWLESDAADDLPF